MLTKRQNLLETIKGGNLTVVNRYEFLGFIFGDPFR